MSRTIIWDIDDVLNNLTAEWLELGWRPGRADCRVKFEDITANPPHEVLGISLAEYQSSLDHFRSSQAAREMQPVAEVVEWFAQNGAQFRHIALTARPFVAVPPVAEWVFRHFGDWIRAFGFVPTPRPSDRGPVYDRNKGEWVRWIQAGDILVDDSPFNVKVAREAGLKTMLIPQPWNDAEGSLADALAKISQLATA